MTSDAPSEPWRSFLSAIDERLREPVDLHCLGGFVISQCYSLHRSTADLDFLAAIPTQAASDLVHWAGQGSPLHRLHRVYLDAVGGVVSLSHRPHPKLEPRHPPHVDRGLLAYSSSPRWPLDLPLCRPPAREDLYPHQRHLYPRFDLSAATGTQPGVSQR